MELVVRKNDLLRELQLFQGIVERKNTIPILANVLMDAKGDQLRFLATDLEVALRSKALREMVAKTQFAITGEDTRYFLNGAQFVLRPDSMSLVATDGHRLALVTAPRDGKPTKGSGPSAEEENKAILPKKTLGEL